MDEVRSYYADVCGKMKARGRMSADEHAECMRIIGAKERAGIEQLELF